MKGFIFVCGNDGVGKSSVVSYLNQIFKEYISVERSMENLDVNIKLIIDQIDHMTLKYSYDDYVDLQDSILYDNVLYPIYWFVLDAPVVVIEDRIKMRLDKTIWESVKSLEYFRERFRELSAYYGFPLINTVNFNIENVANELINIIDNKLYEQIHQIKTQDLTYDTINNNNIENILSNLLTLEYINQFDCDKFKQDDEFLDENILSQSKNDFNLKKKLICRWLTEGNIDLVDNNNIIVSRNNEKFEIVNKNYFKLLTEGESKQVYKILTLNEYLKDVVVIILKSTIYSHSKQATGYIENLGHIRAKGTKIFLEMLWRNQLKHSYRSVNNNGIIISDFVETNPIEIVFKKYIEGTDKHSYYNIKNNYNIALENGEYKMGPYVRFDWRNPNHVTIKNQTNVIDNPYYYLMEEHFGKELFFKIFLSDVTKVKPFGDKMVSTDIIGSVINIEKSRETIIKLYCTIQSYLNEVGLEVKDGCFMLDNNGNICWSEINQDCMRIINHNNSESLDKDIWRIGGSASKELIKNKWISFNNIMSDYFSKNTFINELKEFNHYRYEKVAKNILADSRLKLNNIYKNIYQKLCSKYQQRRVILTMDLYGGQPVLVQSGKVFEAHSNGNIEEAFNKICLHPDILVVDLNGAIDNNNKCNRNIVKQLATKYYVHAGGGLRTLDDVQDVLQASARRIVISSNLDDQFIKQIPKERLIVELSLDEDNYILINGRKTNTGIKFNDKIKDLVKLEVEAISITFHHTEGHLKGIPREQIKQLMTIMPDCIRKIIIAGGVSSIDDLEFLWSFKNVIPQLGSAIWKNKISIGSLYSAMANFDSNGLIPAIIQDKYGLVKGLIYMDKISLEKS